jgi:hypothetical protein
MWMLSVTERMRLASVKALRGVFTGVGQLLLAADRLKTEAETELERADSNGVQDPLGSRENGRKSDTASQRVLHRLDLGARDAGGTDGATQKAAHQGRPEASGKTTASQGAASAVSVAPQRPPWRSLDTTGNVRLLTSEELAEAAKATPAKPGPGGPATSIPVKASPATARPAAATPAPPTPAPPTPAPPTPIPGYGDLSLASLRARLRSLSVYQLTQLVDYEKSHANRAEVVTLFERRIIKLGTGEHGRDAPDPNAAQHPKTRPAQDTVTPTTS